MMYSLMLLSIAGAAGSWGIAVVRYGASRPRDWESIEIKLPGWRMLNAKYWVDEIYQATVVAAFMKTRLVLAEMDRFIVDGIVNGAAVVGRGASWLIGTIDNQIGRAHV